MRHSYQYGLQSAYLKNSIYSPSAGYLHVTVTPANVTVDYVGTVLSADETDTKINGEIVYSYTLATP